MSVAAAFRGMHHGTEEIKGRIAACVLTSLTTPNNSPFDAKVMDLLLNWLMCPGRTLSWRGAWPLP